MHSSYITSTISLRYKGSLSFSVSDYTCFVDDRFDRNPISFSPSSCCSCCANSTNRVPINPTFLYGLRQSTLIQWSPSRRLILGGVNQCYSRFPVCDIDPNCYYQKSYSFKERGTSARRGRWRKGNYGRTVLEERGKRRNLCEANDAEVILSLLTEEVGEKCLGVRERNGRSSRRVQVEKRGNRTKKNNVGSGGLESNSKCEHQAVEFQSREEDNRRKEDRRKEEREFLSGGEGLRARKEGSSCSSYYSFSTLGESESDSEVQVKRDEFVGESSSEYKTDRKGTGEIRYDGEFQEEIERDAGDAVEHGVSLEKKNTAKGLYSASSGIECDWRKKSEKKLAEVSVEQAEARKESSQKLFRSSEVNRSGYDSNARKQNNYRDEKSTLAVSTDEGTRQKYSQIGDKISGQSESRMKYNQLRETEQIHSSVIKTSSNSEKQYRGREDYKSGDRITRQDEYDGSTQQLAEVSEIQETDNRGTSTSQRQSETCTDDAEHRQADRRVTRKMNSRGKSQQLTKISDTHDVDVESKIISQRRSETRMKKQEEAFISYPQAKEQRSQMDAKAIRRLESRKESHDVTNDGDAENVTKSVSGKRVSSQEKYLTSVEKSVEETRERQHLTDERVSRIRSRKEAQMPTKVLSLSEGMLDKASSSQASLKLNPQLTVQQITLDEGDKKSSQETMTPPSSATVAGVAVQVERTSGSASRKFSSERLGSGSSISHAQTQTSSPDSQLEIYGGARRDESHGEPLNFISHEDALSSADKSQKFSSHFVDEFVEKVRHEVSTSEVQKVKKTSETKLVHEREQYKQKGHQYGSRDSQPKDRDSRRSSRSSGAKGPSDEMWDVNNPSITIEEPPETEAPEAATTTGKDIVRGSGRSMWGIISDIVRMRWASRSESHNSRSGRRSSPNQSTSSEAWFSGHEHDENVGDTVKKERSSVPQSVDQQQGVIHAQSQGEVSSLISSTDKIKHVGVASQSLSNTESELASKGNSSSSIEETYAEHLEGNSGTAISKPTFPLPAIRMRRSPGVQEISGGTTDASGSGTMVQMTEVSGTEGKDGEVKRRKLQRNKQVPKDRFDEWEEAFTLETEQRKIDEMFMKEALLEAKKAGDMWEVPVGAVLVQHGKIIARGYNLVEELRDSTAHAEMICIREASNILQSWRLSETTLYVTLEPCPMCAGAILQARVDTVVWGAPNKLLGADGSWIRLFPNGSEEGTSSEPADKPAAPVHPFHPKMKIRRGVLATECADVMTEFFQLRRRKKEKKTEPPTPPSCLPISNHPSKFFTKMHDAFNIMFCL